MLSAPDQYHLSFDNLKDLVRALDKISFEEFFSIQRKVLNTGPDYAKNSYPSFMNNPIAYCTSRFPPAQGEALINLGIEKIKELS